MGMNFVFLYFIYFKQSILILTFFLSTVGSSFSRRSCCSILILTFLDYGSFLVRNCHSFVLTKSMTSK